MNSNTKVTHKTSDVKETENETEGGYNAAADDDGGGEFNNNGDDDNVDVDVEIDDADNYDNDDDGDSGDNDDNLSNIKHFIGETLFETDNLTNR